ncbi:GMC oxidoreductase [Primorskyibacter flagellatus]|uniref:Choline dehydrogenase n=1 Tax=Primorskyibacter flagellatus TaxID=1387277 RepID=A0A1W2E012_9RHOB|nr:GMC family oxidoreductase [Primorskyibacter flagellatus]SMD03049.1 Choline dehydrogenase [Primorskyibacter flagellatus]
MGGGLLGRRLTEHGLRVLFVEKGPAGFDMDRHSPQHTPHAPHARQIRGMWPKPVESRLEGVATRFFGPYGSGVGGSSVFYAAGLERPERHDIDDAPNIPHPTGGWPVSFDEYRPYLDEATKILRLCGTPDPLSPEGPQDGLNTPLPASAADETLMQEMQALGLHPYRLHLAVRHPETCRKCFGSKCPWGCKMDGRSAGVIPALETGRAALLDNCEVQEILDDGTRVTGLRVKHDDMVAELHASTYALCAGSLASPRLLLASNSRCPEGCANSNGWVGRGLMFHVDEIFVLWPKDNLAKRGPFGKSISLRDLYSPQGERFGLVQSIGLDASYGNIVYYMGRIFDQSPLRRFRRLRGLIRFPAFAASRLFGKAAVFVGMMEDYPYKDNRVVLNSEDPEILTFEYRFHAELMQRRKRFRRMIYRAFKGHWRFLVSMRPVLNFGHPLGTLRFGTDTKNSVLRPDCRTHDLDNLYVADGAFMPSSMGVNPSLMIAANALRVGDIIARVQNETEKTQHAAAE